jgi:transposase
VRPGAACRRDGGWSVAYLVPVRYPDGGGLTAECRARREAVRLQAAALFVSNVPVPEIARRLRVSHNAVYVWRRRWLADGETGLASRGAAGSVCRLTDDQLEQLAAALDEGPAAHGYIEDQRWTLARVAELIVRLFRQRYTLRGVSLLLHRMGFSPQIPKHRPVERDEAAIATWRREVWPQAK